MAELVADCPRCNARGHTFDVTADTYVGEQYGWQNFYEVFGVCRNCKRSTTFVISQKHTQDKNFIAQNGILKFPDSMNRHFEVREFISLKDRNATEPPKHLPKDIKAVFNEGARCLAVGCYNASGTMFRLCVDLATEAMLPEAHTEGLRHRARRDLGPRLDWLFENHKLPEALHELSTCIKDDGNDGAHRGTLSREDAENLLDFTFELLKRLYTDPEEVKLAKIRREERNKPKVAN